MSLPALGDRTQLPDEAYELPASHAQQRLWFLDQLLPENTSYLIPWRIRLLGHLDPSALSKALHEIIQRHEALRTTFRSRHDEVLQIVSPALSLELPFRDISGHPDPEEEAKQLARDEARRPLNLETGPLIRACLLKLSSREHVLLLTLHHIIFDGWSRSIFARELGTLYEAFKAGHTSPLAQVRLQYGDYVVWQRDQLNQIALDTHLAYWKEQLDGAPSETALPFDHPRPVASESRAAQMRFEFPVDLSSQLAEFSRRHGATLFMTLLAGFQALLSRYTGQEDLVVGTPVANRTRRELEEVIGLFANTLPLRLDLSGQPSLIELTDRAKKLTLGAYEHQDLPFEKLVQELNPERRQSVNPFFQVAFSLGNVPHQAFQLPGLELRLEERIELTAKFDLFMLMHQQADRLSGSVEYNADLFDETTIERMVGHFRSLLEGMLGDPTSPFTRVALVDGAEQSRLLLDWNATAREYPQLCVHELFEAQAKLTPQAIAVVASGQILTYHELNAQADRLSSHLRGLGFGLNEVVGIFAERSREAIVAMLAVLKAGAAYLPLAPDYPTERLNAMAENAEISVLLAQSALVERAPERCKTIICLDHPETWLSYQTEEFAERPTPESLAYVMYTSGSTGQPKGAEIRHKSIVRLLFSADYANFGPQEVFLSLASLSFDAATFEIWGALLHGAKLVLFPARVPTVAELGKVIQEQRISILWLTASLFNAIIDEAATILAPIRQLLVGGEALSVKHVCKALRELPGTQLINGYGPTEGTTFTTCYPIPRDVSPEVGSIPLGRPISNTTVYVLDRNKNLAPIGIPGELYIGGDGLAIGYRNRPDLTEASFIHDPFSAQKGERLYASGDLVRYRQDGLLEYLGRLDNQIKLRGFRIELAEIDAALCQLPGVMACAVALREDSPGDKCLTAYVVPSGPAIPSWTDLRLALQKKLPDYMIPSALVVLPCLPLTPNGKIDRKSLPAPKHLSRTDKAEPKTSVEAKLLAIWSQVLKRPSIGLHDDFFELGGHSLLAVTLFTRIEGEFGQKLPLNSLFAAPTVAQLAACFETADPQKVQTSIRPCRTGGSKSPIFAAHGIGGTVLTFRTLAKCLDPDQPIYCLEALELGKGWKTLEELAAHYAEDIVSFQSEGPYHIIGSSFGGMVAFEIARKLRSQDREVGLVGLLDSSNLGARNLLPWRERLEKQWLFLWRRVLMHLKRFPDRKLSEWPRYAVGRLLAVGRRLHGALWRTAYRSVSTVGTEKPSILKNMKRAYELAGLDYFPQVCPGTIVLFRRSEHITKAQIERHHGWTGLAAGGLEVINVPGDHNSILSEPNVTVLASEITAWLDRYTAQRDKRTGLEEISLACRS